MRYQLAEETMLYQSIFCLFLITVAVSGKPVTPVPFLVNGTDTYILKYPFMASLRRNNVHFCGGAIVSPRFILTAAHCLRPFAGSKHKLENVTVVTGSHNLYVGGEAHEPEAVHPHKGYSKDKPGSDIGLMKLKGPIKFSDNQNTIPLPTSDLPAGAKITIVAWGSTDYPMEDMSPQLQDLSLATIGPEECRSYYAEGYVADTEFCTKPPPGVGICKGDSGSPTTYNGRIVGIVSKGVPCATGKPDIFTNVYKYLDYVKETMKK